MRRVCKGSIMVALTVLLTISGITSPIPALADDDQVGRGTDWTLKVKTEALERYFEYKNSNLRGVEKVMVGYYPKEEENRNRDYEKLWYHEGKPLGMERLNPLEQSNGEGIPQGESVSIEVITATTQPKDSELKAAANVILRLWLDAQMNKNALVKVKLPAASFQSIAAHLKNQNCYEMPSIPDEKPRSNPMTVLLISEPEGQKMKMSYLPQN